MFQISEDDLVVTVHPYQNKYVNSGEILRELPREKQGFETSIYGTTHQDLEGETVADYSFRMNLDYGVVETERFIDEVYGSLVSRLHSDFPCAEILSGSESDLEVLFEPW